MKKIAVLLSAYNGDKYIEEQIASIYHQKYTDFQLYVRDDGSKKEFVELLKKLQLKYGFELITGENMGFLKSFMFLLDYAEGAELYAFADQDDIWLEDKLQNAVSWFEQDKENKTPRLYHSAYDIIDDRHNVAGHFYFPNEGYDFRRSITENHYSGFAMVINAKLREYMLKGDCDQIGYHDWWAAMIVQAFGQGWSDDRVTALHRVHGDNVTAFNMKTRLQWLKKSLLEESELHKRAVEFERCYKEELTPENRKIIQLFSARRYNLGYALKKCLYPGRWRPVLSSEIVMRFLMLIGKV